MQPAIHTRLAYLRHLLRNLPETLPFKSAADSRYAFQHFQLDDKWIDSEGIEVAANRALEVALGPRTGLRETFVIEERGPGLEALADVLRVYLGKFPDDFRFQKWLNSDSATILKTKEVLQAAIKGLDSFSEQASQAR